MRAMLLKNPLLPLRRTYKWKPFLRPFHTSLDPLQHIHPHTNVAKKKIDPEIFGPLPPCTREAPNIKMCHLFDESLRRILISRHL